MQYKKASKNVLSRKKRYKTLDVSPFIKAISEVLDFIYTNHGFENTIMTVDLLGELVKVQKKSLKEKQRPLSLK